MHKMHIRAFIPTYIAYPKTEKSADFFPVLKGMRNS